MLSQKQLLILSILAIGWLLQQQQAQAQVVIYARDPIADRMAVQLDAYRFGYMVASDRWRWRLEVAERHRSKLERMRADLRMAGHAGWIIAVISHPFLEGHLENLWIR